MADDEDEIMDELDDTAAVDDEPGEPAEDELDEEDLVVDEEDFDGEVFEEVDEVEEDDDDEDDADGPTRRSVAAATAAGEEDDDDDDIIAPDDVEADLDTILKDRLVAADEEANDDDEEPEDRTDTGDRLQPKRADEQLCPRCFLLVRQSAPLCPVGDDECPLFS